jgi:hypothetical protein
MCGWILFVLVFCLIFLSVRWVIFRLALHPLRLDLFCSIFDPVLGLFFSPWWGAVDIRNFGCRRQNYLVFYVLSRSSPSSSVLRITIHISFLFNFSIHCWFLFVFLFFPRIVSHIFFVRGLWVAQFRLGVELDFLTHAKLNAGAWWSQLHQFSFLFDRVGFFQHCDSLSIFKFYKLH